jgi:hypothetical protein
MFLRPSAFLHDDGSCAKEILGHPAFENTYQSMSLRRVLPADMFWSSELALSHLGMQFVIVPLCTCHRNHLSGAIETRELLVHNVIGIKVEYGP